jgi:hypothetical protein
MNHSSFLLGKALLVLAKPYRNCAGAGFININHKNKWL